MLVFVLENVLTFHNDKNRVMAVEDFKMEISVDKPLLTKELKKVLNPLMLNIVGAK